MNQNILSTVIPANPIDLYDVNEWYYYNSDVFKKLASGNLGPGSKTRALENPAHEIVEFYATVLWPETLDELPITAKTQAIEDAAREVFQWGNWGQVKQEVARLLPMHGDVYLKAEDVEDSDRAYPRTINPRHITEFEKDERGFCIRTRLDIPIEVEGRNKTHTELWDKKENLYAVWEHERGPGTKIEELGTPKEKKKLTDFGISFVPFVHSPFKGTGKERGQGAYTHALEQINEMCKMASRLNDLLFRHGKPVWALLRNEAGASAVGLEELSSIDGEQSDSVEVGQGEETETLIRPPGLSTLESLIPPIPYADALAILQDKRDRLTTSCPELLYFAARDKGDPSGRALSLILAPAQDKAKEARYNGETAVMQCVKMCITIAQTKGAFKGVGSFDNGDFDDLVFEKRQVLPQSDLEKAEAEKAKLEVLELKARILGLPLSALRREMDIDDEDIQPVGPGDTVVDTGTNGDVAAQIAERLGATNGQP